jgi:RimJ/RimL family protein N-acetyltransferase
VVIELRRLQPEDVAAHCAGEDDATVRWLTGGYGTVEGTLEHFATLARNAEAGSGKQGFGVWMGERLCGYVDYDPDLTDGLDAEDVNISYAVHPWARGRGVAVAAVELVCERLRGSRIGRRAAIRVEPENAASVRVAEKAGFRFVREFVSGTDVHADGTPATMALYLLDL